MSKVMAMWIMEGLWIFLSRADHAVLGHSLPFRNAGASRKEGNSAKQRLIVTVKIKKRLRGFDVGMAVEEMRAGGGGELRVI